MTVAGFAVDLGGTKIAVARIVDGVVSARRQRPTQAGADLDGQLQSIGALLEDVNYRRGEPLGVAVAGRVDRDGNWHAVNTATLSAIAAAPLGEALRERFGKHALATNDAAAAALAEYRLGAGQGAYNFAYLTVSTGVGGGLVLGGRLIDSLTGLAGHVGFTSSQLGKDRCGSGRMGTVESVAGGRAIAAAAGMGDAKTVFAGDPQNAAIHRSEQAVAGLIGDLTAILGLDQVAIGGSIGLAPNYIAGVRTHLDQEPALFRPPVVPAGLGNDSGLVGALLHCLEST
ncbi:ROK family protein [Devosia sp. RR2S18]|uniref:ROK family protein n=1 Tax=Devosia rhizosphaerae TaxID=3049774 RepID=UPI002540C8ED|nr:ROK family protein [Devosia sp. RR2S18]WIJ27007.1 ROK family protein [Devosia sp. RR2S18]